MAPPGQHVMSCFVQYARMTLKAVGTIFKKEAFAETVIATIEQYAPNIRRAIIGKQIITPVDMSASPGSAAVTSSMASCCCTNYFFCGRPRSGPTFRTPLPGYLPGSQRGASGRGCHGCRRQAGCAGDSKGWPGMKSYDVIIIGAGHNALVHG